MHNPPEIEDRPAMQLTHNPPVIDDYPARQLKQTD